MPKRKKNQNFLDKLQESIDSSFDKRKNWFQHSQLSNYGLDTLYSGLDQPFTEEFRTKEAR